MGEKEKWITFIMKRCGTRGVFCCEWPALLFGAIMKSQPELQLKAMSGSVAVEQQKSVSISMAHITPREHGDTPSWGSH